MTHLGVVAVRVALLLAAVGSWITAGGMTRANQITFPCRHAGRYETTRVGCDLSQRDSTAHFKDGLRKTPRAVGRLSGRRIEIAVVPTGSAPRFARDQRA